MEVLLTSDLKRELLTSLYSAYDETATHYVRACRAGCHDCCTRNVLCTTLEADLMVHYLETANRPDLIERVMDTLHERMHRPSITLNELAAYCLRRQEPPEPETVLPTAACPLLEDGICPVYDVRPFACRCLWSEEPCAVHGEARMNPTLVSLNGVFEQMIEHMDAGGLYGNLLDLLSLPAFRESKDAYGSSHPLQPTSHLLETKPNPGFLVPPLHRPTVIAALNRLRDREICGLSFREVLRQIR
ncbi:MAG: hypothetical protein RDU20_16405 [Desulfomonilaceae bacterium]|nr:hypothetical protein [Desulfomonilaceae bacterium]